MALFVNLRYVSYVNLTAVNTYINKNSFFNLILLDLSDMHQR